MDTAKQNNKQGKARGLRSLLADVVLMLTLVLFPASAAPAAEAGLGVGGGETIVSTAVSPEGAPGWLDTLAKQPWAKRLAHMWAGEEQDDSVGNQGGSVDAILNLVERGNLFQVFRRGGPIMWPLLCAALLSLATVLERAGFFTLERFRRNTAEQRTFMRALREGHFDEAEAIGRRSRYYVVRVLGYALTQRGGAMEGAVQYAKERELHRYRRGIPMLDTVITLAPLLGLLGTVTGMMASFSLIGGELGAPGAITGGIAEALLATAFGLGIAITSLIPFNLMNQKLETATQEIDEAASSMMISLAAHGVLAAPLNAGQEEGGAACMVA
ncbi:MAG: MotA/TolQ/ExbB proton channel family protein [bacterium]